MWLQPHPLRYVAIGITRPANTLSGNQAETEESLDQRVLAAEAAIASELQQPLVFMLSIYDRVFLLPMQNYRYQSSSATLNARSNQTHDLVSLT